jgi:hypothetical protein
MAFAYEKGGNPRTKQVSKGREVPKLPFAFQSSWFSLLMHNESVEKVTFLKKLPLRDQE